MTGLSGGVNAKVWPQPALGDLDASAGASERVSGGAGGGTGGEAGKQASRDAGDVEVLFTFDDGPNPATTPAILDLLAERKVRAVFFLIGAHVEKHKAEVPAILDRIVREGHILANHTMFHTNLCETPEEEAIADLDGGREVIERAAQLRINWFRAPFGVRCDRLEAMLAERHMTHLHWDLDPQEWKHGVKRTVKYVTDKLSRASGRNVLLMHDIKRVTVEALPKIFEWMDEENARRAKTHQRMIKILQAPDLAVERLPPGLLGWLSEAARGARALPEAIASVLP